MAYIGYYNVNWNLPHTVFGNEPGAYWHATEEQKARSAELEKRCQEADILLYRRNRTVSLIAVR